MPKPTSPSSISTLSPTNPDSASKLQKRKSQPSLDTDESFSPSPPPAHKRRKLTSSAVARSASLNESTVLANSKQKKSSKDKKSRAGSAPVTSPPTAFPGPNDDVATEVRAVTNLQAPSTTIIHPPLTAKELDDILSGASMMSHPAKLPTPINTSTLSNMSISQLQDLVPTPSNTHFPVQFYPLIPSADQISSSNAQVSLDLSSIGSFEPPDNLDFNSLQGANILTNQIMSQAPSSMLTTGDVTQFVQNEDLSSFMVPPMLHTTYSSPQPSLSSSPSSSPTSSFCSSPTSSTPSSTSLVKHPFLPTAQPPVVVATDRKELIRRKLELLETQRKALQMEMELEELESASAAGSQSVSRDFQSSIDLLSVM
ncbi:hypothetical protein DL93DRAFT_1917498 [Clavulina sp. PMI_390]|nr:hypothetical protein DL93DRAFT_1917498 [Clavulina sp. PMI_390]